MHLVKDNIDFERYLKDRDAQKIKPASDWTDQVVERMSGSSRARGDLLPWVKTHEKIQFRQGEVSLWAGINGHGKSLMQGQAMLWLLPYSRVLIASLEMLPPATLERMIRQASGGHHPSQDWVKKWMRWTDDRLWIYDQQDSVRPEKVLGMVAYAAEKLQVNHIVIDSLMKCGMNPDDYGPQKRFIDRLCWLAKDTGIHIHLVAHIRKGEKEGHVPDKFDIKGTSEISDLVDNVLIVHRNKDKEAKVERGADVDVGIPDASLIVAKQRHGEWEGRIVLWFHLQSNQFVPKPKAGAMPWPDPDQQRAILSDRQGDE